MKRNKAVKKEKAREDGDAYSSVPRPPGVIDTGYKSGLSEDENCSNICDQEGYITISNEVPASWANEENVIETQGRRNRANESYLLTPLQKKQLQEDVKRFKEKELKK